MAGGKTTCQYCGSAYSTRGITAHEKSCQKRHATAQQDRELEEQLRTHALSKSRKRRRRNTSSSGEAAANVASGSHDTGPHVHAEMENNNPSDVAGPSDSQLTDDNEEPPARMRLPTTVQMDDIKVEYHPKSGRPTTIHPFEEFKRDVQQEQDIPPSSEPWKPFQSRADFEFAEIVLQASLNTRYTDALIKLIRRVRDEQAKFTFTSHSDLKRSFETAALTHTAVSIP
ncbi:hypothetical protein EUX98_g7061 [Antrodiella citrinella]|uniref:Uncharacterized protein n=1 Tax=Antrodiella citrinella TaxID=2447956 RepID=A0A4S4MP93_9APHY|nr:hypothetical protein EUX98_g7061 [Antrodiella citrinella]